ncbi:MAG: DUF367 family protein [Thermoproteota archaeon]|nr:DUF367 family protein [Nitrosopumilus sp.]MDQ3083984.1 DUF367 family protein [Thermoproteota archaeon]
MSESSAIPLELAVLMYRQDDPNKCTASRLVKFKMAKEVRRVPTTFLVLNPFAEKMVTPADIKKFRGICAIDCSWNLATQVINTSKKFFNNRKLPALLAGNPTNYAKLGMLSTVEAISAALYILNYKEMSREILNKFKWGHTFLDLNSEILEEYSNAQGQDEIITIEKDYFPHIFNS